MAHTMNGNLEGAIRTLLVEALPGLLGGTAPPVALLVESEHFAAAANESEPQTSEPRPDDQIDQFALDPSALVLDPVDPAYDPAALPAFTLTRPPYPGPRRVRLLTEAGDRVPLQESEVQWGEVDTRRMALMLAPSRDLAGVTGVEVLYGVVAVFTTLKLRQTLHLQFSAPNVGQLERCTALAIGALELNRSALLDGSAATFGDGEYTTSIKITSLRLLEGSSPSGEARRLVYEAEIELKSTRALRSDEGRPIARIRTPGRPVDGARPVDIVVGVDA